jgi:hypothetical protein
MTAWIVVAVMVAAVAALLWMIRRRAWNVDGSDDRRRKA